MAKKVEIEQVLANLEKAQNKLAKRWADAILKSDFDKSEVLRNHMLALVNYRKDIEAILEQINEYIATNKLLVGMVKRTKKKKSAPKSSGKYFRTKPLPPIGTELYGKYKGKNFVATITNEGIKVNGIQKIFSSMSSATAAVTGKKTISGWVFWKVKNPKSK